MQLIRAWENLFKERSSKKSFQNIFVTKKSIPWLGDDNSTFVTESHHHNKFDCYNIV